MANETSISPVVAPQIFPEKNNDSNAFDAGARKQFVPVGSSGTDLFSGYFSEEYLQQLRGKRGAKIYDEMRRSEAQVAMLLGAIMNPIKSATSEFEANLDVPQGQIHKDFIEYCAKEMIDWDTHIHEALTMLIYGYSIFEIVNNVVYNHPKFGTFNGLKALAFRSQKTIERWLVDRSTGELSQVEQWVQGDLVPGNSAIIQMMAEFLLVFTVQKEGDNYEGISTLRPMYGPWFRKNLYQKIMGIGLEKTAIGTPVGTIPTGKNTADQENAFKETLSSFTAHENAYITKPQGWEIEFIESNFDASKLKDAITLENTEMINSVVANFLALGTNGSGGAYALGSDLSDFFLTGIQNYANLIAGVWNRKLIPNLIKLNFGPQPAYPKLKFTGINDKAGEELSKVIQNLTTAKVIKPDTPLEDFIRKQYSLPKADPTTSREVSAPKLFSEQIKLAESYKTQWNNNKKSLKEVMQAGLKTMLEDYKSQISRAYKGATPAAKVSLGNNLTPKLSSYKKDLQEALAEIANEALIGAKKETPKAKSVKLSERIQLAAPKGGYFDALPPGIKRIVKSQADLIANTQSSDLEKIVAFQYSSSQSSTQDIDQILLDIDEAASPTIEGSTGKGVSVDAAAGDAVSTISSQARLEWFFEPEVLDTIESFTFENEDPISPICQELDGTTWDVNDPDIDRYSPPLHHNCKSRLVPNEKGADKNPEIDRGGTPVTQKALDSITLCECSYHLEFKLSEKPNKLADLSPEDQKKISDKIAKLVGEGKDQKQAAAIAYSMLERGEL